MPRPTPIRPRRRPAPPKKSKPPKPRVNPFTAKGKGSTKILPRQTIATVAPPTGPTAANPSAPPPPPVGPPPQTYRTAADRIEAEGGYGTTQADINRQIRELALGFGGVDSVDQYSFSKDPNDPYKFIDNVSRQAVMKNDPLSQVAQIERARKANQQANDFRQNEAAANNFFSGANQVATRQVADEASRNNEQARRDYQNAVAALMTQLLGARGTRNKVYGDALATEITAANATDPEAEAEDPTPPAAGADATTEKKKPAPKKKPKKMKGWKQTGAFGFGTNTQGNFEQSSAVGFGVPKKKVKPKFKAK